jgi:hypothetical protein
MIPENFDLVDPIVVSHMVVFVVGYLMGLFMAYNSNDHS